MHNSASPHAVSQLFSGYISRITSYNVCYTKLLRNEEHGITPETVKKNIAEPIGQACEADYVTVLPEEAWDFASAGELARHLRKLRKDIVITSYSIHYTKLYEILPEIPAARRSVPVLSIRLLPGEAHRSVCHTVDCMQFPPV